MRTFYRQPAAARRSGNRYHRPMKTDLVEVIGGVEAHMAGS
jgi:hypothetical protein